MNGKKEKVSTIMLKGAANTAMLKMAQIKPTA